MRYLALLLLSGCSAPVLTTVDLAASGSGVEEASPDATSTPPQVSVDGASSLMESTLAREAGAAPAPDGEDAAADAAVDALPAPGMALEAATSSADPIAACRYELPPSTTEAWVVDHYPCGKIVGRFEIPGACQAAPNCGCILGNVTPAAFTQAGSCRCYNVDGTVVFEEGCP